MIKFIFLFNKIGKPRIVRFYDNPPESQRLTVQKDVSSACLAHSKQEGIIDYKDYVLVYRHYGNLVFTAGITGEENELAVLELLHNLVETLMKYLNKVSEADIILNMDKVYMILDEMIIEGYISETNHSRILAPLQLLDTVRK